MTFMHEAISKMQADGLVIRNPMADGQLHRCPVENKPNRKDGAYIIYNDTPQTAWWKNWVTDIEGSYTDIPQRLMTPKERKEYKKRIEANKKAAQEEEENKHKNAAKEAQKIIDKAEAATDDHPYLTRKRVGAFGNLKIESKTGNLIIPLFNEQGKLQSLQRIYPNKPDHGYPEKPFLTGGKTASCYYPIPSKDNTKDGPLLIGEGYATCASGHMATGYACLVAFSAGNLLAVAKIARSKYPYRKIVILADYDVSKSEQEKKQFPEAGGKGVAKAKEAACEIGAYLSIPPSPNNDALDFNDLHCNEGLAYIQKIISESLADKPQAKKTKIIYRQGALPRLVKELEQSIAGFAWQMDKLIVHITRLPASRSFHGLRQPAGLSVITAFDKNSLCLLTSEKAEWVKQKIKDGVIESEYKINPSMDVISCFLAAYGQWTLPQLTGLVTCPIMRPDGSILDKPGYDEITGLYADFNPSSFYPVEENPSKETAVKALDFLKYAISEFPFKTDVDRSVALAGLLTAVMRPSVAHAPLIAFSAPTPGTGKSTLADLIGIVATGKPCSAMDYNADTAEFKKAVFATLLEGPPVVLIDNCVGEVNSSLLNMVITQESIKGRILGLSQNANLSTISLWLATGNNLTIVGDLTRRTLFCTLDAGVESPAKRQFKRDIYQWAEIHRGELVSAALTVLRAFHCADCQQEMEPMNGFNRWSKLIRGALLWLGEADPKDSQLEIEAHDPEREVLRTVFHAWYEHFGNQFVTTKDLLNRNPPYGEIEIPDSQQGLYQALVDVIPHGRELTSKKLGHWLSQYNGRVIDGLKLIDTGQRDRRATYWKILKT